MIDGKLFKDLKRVADEFKKEIDEYEDEEDKETGLEALRTYNVLFTLCKRLHNKGMGDLAEILILVMNATAMGEKYVSIMKDITYNGFKHMLIMEAQDSDNAPDENETGLLNDDGTRVTLEEVEKMWNELSEEEKQGK